MDVARHESIIALIDVFSDDAYLYIVQELHGTISYAAEDWFTDCWPNGSRCLESYIHANVSLSPEDAKYVFYQLVDAVEHLHSFGISHCDIKPGNILIDSTTLKIKLIEFGNVLRMTTDCTPGKSRCFYFDPGLFFCGTRSYMPPELLNGEMYEANAADILAMGMVLCLMVLGHRPFNSLEQLKEGELGCHQNCFETLGSVGLIVCSCLKMEMLLRPTAAELQLGDDYLPIALRRDKLIGKSTKELWPMLGQF